MLLNSLSSLPSSLQIFPDEILLMVFSEADIPTLLSLSDVCKRFKRLANICLASKFKEQNVSLTLTFGQEHRLRSNVMMEFHHVNEENGNFVFQPNEEEIAQLKYYNSTMVNGPKIYKVTLHNAMDDIKATTRNLLQKSIGFPIKIREGICQTFQNVYRSGHGSSHLKIPFAFSYSVVCTPPPNETISRGGERWITPLSFECPPTFFYPNEAAVYRILKSMKVLIPTKKQQSIKKTVVSDIKQKQRISFQQESQTQVPISQEIPQTKVVHEKKKLFMVPSKWVRGARH